MITLTLQIVVVAKGPHDEIRIDGKPPPKARIGDGVAEDDTAVAMVVNSIPNVLKARAGLVTSLELPLPSAYMGRVYPGRTKTCG